MTRDFLTYDLEWAKGNPVVTSKGDEYHHPKVRMAGVYCKKRGYRWYKTIEDFLNAELTHKNRGKWFYAHAGGLADMLFVMEYLADNPVFHVDASFSGSSAIIVHIRRGKNVWHFIDSYWLLKGKLADIAKIVGMEKGEVDSFDDAPLEKLVPYNELDCVILWKAIDAFENALLEIGGQLQMTLASCSMFLFRKRFLKRTIHTSQWVNERARQSYIASRVEVFELKCQNAYYYDINSSFPYAMTFECPGNLLMSDKRLTISRLQDPDYQVLADLTIEVPEMYFPPLPFRTKTSVYFPTGKWRCWFTGVDIALLLEKGGDIVKVHEVLHFDSFDDLSEFASVLYDKRLKSETESEKYTVKILLNSLYGKFAEGSLKTSLLLHPPTTKCPHWPRHEDDTCIEMLFPGAFLIENEIEVPHAHVPISSVITARARRILYGHMHKAGNFHYCDTDGFSTTNENVETSEKLGGLKLELEIKKGQFVRPKFYRLDDKVRAKGFSLRPQRDDSIPIDKREKWEEKMKVERYLKLVNGQAIEMERFSRIKELYRQGITTPTERKIKKRMQNKVRNKRDVLRGGKTRPWRVEELDS